MFKNGVFLGRVLGGFNVRTTLLVEEGCYKQEGIKEVPKGVPKGVPKERQVQFAVEGGGLLGWAEPPHNAEVAVSHLRERLARKAQTRTQS